MTREETHFLSTLDVVPSIKKAKIQPFLCQVIPKAPPRSLSLFPIIRYHPSYLYSPIKLFFPVFFGPHGGIDTGFYLAPRC